MERAILRLPRDPETYVPAVSGAAVFGGVDFDRVRRDEAVFFADFADVFRERLAFADGASRLRPARPSESFGRSRSTCSYAPAASVFRFSASSAFPRFSMIR